MNKFNGPANLKNGLGTGTSKTGEMPSSVLSQSATNRQKRERCDCTPSTGKRGPFYVKSEGL